MTPVSIKAPLCSVSLVRRKLPPVWRAPEAVRARPSGPCSSNEWGEGNRGGLYLPCIAVVVEVSTGGT